MHTHLHRSRKQLLIDIHIQDTYQYWLERQGPRYDASAPSWHLRNVCFTYWLHIIHEQGSIKEIHKHRAPSWIYSGDSGIPAGYNKTTDMRFQCLSTETIQSTSGTLECVHDIESSDSFARWYSVFNQCYANSSSPLSMLGVCNGITDNVLEEDFEDTTGFFVDETGDTLNTTTTSKTTNGRFCDTWPQQV